MRTTHELASLLLSCVFASPNEALAVIRHGATTTRIGRLAARRDANLGVLDSRRFVPPMLAHWPPQDRSQVVRAYVDARESAESIARRYGVTPRTVLLFLHKQGVQVRYPGLGTFQAAVDVEAVCAAYRAGASTDQLAQRFGRSQTAVLKLLRSAGEPLRPPGSGRPRPTFEHVLTREFLQEHYLERRMRLTAVAAEVGCSTTTVAAWLHKHGIVPRPAKTTPPSALTEAASLRALLAEHGTIRGVAEHLGCSQANVRAWMARHRLRPTDKPSIDPAHARRLYDAGYSCKQIGQLLGVSRDTVRRRLRAQGVTLRRMRTVVDAEPLTTPAQRSGSGDRTAV